MLLQAGVPRGLSLLWRCLLSATPLLLLLYCEGILIALKVSYGSCHSQLKRLGYKKTILAPVLITQDSVPKLTNSTGAKIQNLVGEGEETVLGEGGGVGKESWGGTNNGPRTWAN